MQTRIKFIKTKGPEHEKVLKGHDFSIHMHAVNLMQNTAWVVDRDVLDTAQEVWKKSLGTGMPPTEPYEPPPKPFQGLHYDSLTEAERDTLAIWRREAMLLHIEENTRKGKIMSFARTLSTANKYKDKKEFYYVYNCDFRGRVYCTTVGMSPQGADLGKALIRFARGKELGEHGARYLQIHGANVYGEDKLPYTGRIQWCCDHEEAIIAVATDPMSSESRSFWGDADKPYQFLAFCFEYKRFIDSGRSAEFVSHLPVGADGTCNGLQHFSALLCDPVGAGATNLAPSDAPDDIYKRVADVVADKLEHSDHEYAEAWRVIGITRKITKKPVMTLPYGSTLNACTDAVNEFLMENRQLHPWTASNRLKAARFMSSLIWESIGEVVIAARSAMKWLRSCAAASNKKGRPMIWTSPSGFKVYHGKPKYLFKRIQVSMLGRTRITVGKPTGKLDPLKQLSGISPNYIHSLDSGHMVLTIINAHAHGVTSFAMIHDDFGTHAGDLHVLHKAIRDEFVGIYSNHTLLYKFVQECTIGTGIEYPPIPEVGTFNVQDVHKSLYFFS
jgi:DNA-directed RNA polymerase